MYFLCHYKLCQLTDIKQSNRSQSELSCITTTVVIACWLPAQGSGVSLWTNNCAERYSFPASGSDQSWRKVNNPQNVAFVFFSKIIKLSAEIQTLLPLEQRRLDEYRRYRRVLTALPPGPMCCSPNCVKMTQLLRRRGPLVLLGDTRYFDNCTTPIGKETRNFLDNKIGLFWVLGGQDVLHLATTYLERCCFTVSELKLLPVLRSRVEEQFFFWQLKWLNNVTNNKNYSTCKLKLRYDEIYLS